LIGMMEARRYKRTRSVVGASFQLARQNHSGQKITPEYPARVVGPNPPLRIRLKENP